LLEHDESYATTTTTTTIHLDIVALSILHQVSTALEAIEELRLPPWGNSRDGGIQGLSTQFKTDLERGGSSR